MYCTHCLSLKQETNFNCCRNGLKDFQWSTRKPALWPNSWSETLSDLWGTPIDLFRPKPEYWSATNKTTVKLMMGREQKLPIDLILNFGRLEEEPLQTCCTNYLNQFAHDLIQLIIMWNKMKQWLYNPLRKKGLSPECIIPGKVHTLSPNGSMIWFTEFSWGGALKHSCSVYSGKKSYLSQGSWARLKCLLYHFWATNGHVQFNEQPSSLPQQPSQSD